MAQEVKGDKTLAHELKITDTYLIHSIYEEDPANFVSTVGGFYKDEEGSLMVDLEFNSNYDQDAVSKLELPYTFQGEKLTINTLEFIPTQGVSQALDGQWLFATRGPDTGQERRGDANARKTLKFLLDGRFQWIAYNTDSFKFFGTGGGSFSSADGAYIENIEYFSRDNSRVGAQLSFTYELQEEDWHHKGKNSKGAPMYEIWGKRK